MPKIQNWTYVDTFESKDAHDRFFSSRIETSTVKSNRMKCTVCEVNRNNHDMKYCKRTCASLSCNELKLCKFQYKVLTCLKSESKIKVYSLNEHNLTEQTKPTNHKSYKICYSVKEKIEEIIFEKNIYYPKKIEEALKQYDDLLDTLRPTLEQIQNYIKYRRRKLRDENNIEG